MMSMLFYELWWYEVDSFYYTHLLCQKSLKDSFVVS